MAVVLQLLLIKIKILLTFFHHNLKVPGPFYQPTCLLLLHFLKKEKLVVIKLKV